MTKSKDHIRKEYSKKRNRISADNRHEMDKAIVSNFLRTFAFGTIKTIHIFLTIKDRNEVNTNELIDGILNDLPGTRIVVSCTDMANRSLSHYFWKPGDPLIENKWGIPEPDPAISIEANLKDIDLVAVPLMAFDKNGYRVGYGAGFYDRFLEKCRLGIIKVGLSHFPPLKQLIDIDGHDMKLDFCITPTEVYKF